MVEPFHDGERAVQERMGVREQLARVGPNIFRDFLNEQHRTFFAQLPFVVLGVLDADGAPRATLLAGAPGFLSTPDERTLAVHVLPVAPDPARARLIAGAPVAVLGIELPTRRRNRANGSVARVSDHGFEVHVRQSFGNCPKYIQARAVHTETPGVASPRAHRASTLDEPARSLVARADTFFIASAHPHARDDASLSHGVDVSHRGGKRGFVRVGRASGVDGDVLTVPDFVGNYYFNTLGNLVKDPRAGLVFVDFTSGDLVQIGVDVDIEWEGPAVAAFTGAERLLHMRVRDVVRIEGALALRAEGGEPSPFLEDTGSW